MSGSTLSVSSYRKPSLVYLFNDRLSAARRSRSFMITDLL
jgi:hypothetical protein